MLQIFQEAKQSITGCVNLVVRPQRYLYVEKKKLPLKKEKYNCNTGAGFSLMNGAESQVFNHF